MCGRFALTVDPDELQEAYPDYAIPAQAAPRFNIAPTQPIMAVPNDGSQKADFFVWGLIPSWARDPSIGSRMINARAETLAEKPAFRAAYKYRRCLILANAFFEWQPQTGSKSKLPHLIRLKSGEPFAFAGLWERWGAPDGSEVRSAAIITTSPNPLMAGIHNRMPVILARYAYAQWLDPAPAEPASLQGLLVAYPESEMEAFPISTLVNSPSNDRPDVILPA
jgi:putative SOS response-associated peptidase YedK